MHLSKQVGQGQFNLQTPPHPIPPRPRPYSLQVKNKESELHVRYKYQQNLKCSIWSRQIEIETFVAAVKLEWAEASAPLEHTLLSALTCYIPSMPGGRPCPFPAKRKKGRKKKHIIKFIYSERPWTNNLTRNNSNCYEERKTNGTLYEIIIILIKISQHKHKTHSKKKNTRCNVLHAAYLHPASAHHPQWRASQCMDLQTAKKMWK